MVYNGVSECNARILSADTTNIFLCKNHQNGFYFLLITLFVNFGILCISQTSMYYFTKLNQNKLDKQNYSPLSRPALYTLVSLAKLYKIRNASKMSSNFLQRPERALICPCYNGKCARMLIFAGGSLFLFIFFS